MQFAVLLLPLLLQTQVERVDFGTSVKRRVELLNHTNPRVRMQAARLLGQVQGAREADLNEALAGLLVRLGKDPAAGVRRQAALSLGQLGDERAVPHLARRLRVEPTARVVVALMYGLASCGGPYVAPRVLPFLEHPTQQVRAAAVAALGRLGDPSVRDALLSALRTEPEDPDFAVRAAILTALVRLKLNEEAGSAIDRLIAEKGMKHWGCRAAILAAIGEARLQDRAAFVDAVLKRERDPRVVATAVGALARLGRRKQVLGYLVHEASVVRRAALVALDDTDDELALASALKLAEQERDPSVRFEAALVLHRRRHPDADLYLVDALRSQNPLFWMTALGALERRHGRSFGRDAGAWTKWLKSRKSR